MSTAKKGKEGEMLAALYLREKGYDILEENYRHKRGEIDLIAKKDQVMVFVEVKLKNDLSYGFPEEAVNSRKEGMVIATAENYIYENDWRGPIRFDIVSISGKGEKKDILHVEDAFY